MTYPYILDSKVVKNWHVEKVELRTNGEKKRWINVNAPDSFNNVPIAYVPITDDENASGRVIEITLFDILKGDPSQHQYKLYFQINKVDGEKCFNNIQEI